MSNRPSIVPVGALRRFREECKAEGLSLECALATLAIQASHLDRAVYDDSYLRTLSCIGSMRREIQNLIKALRKEYPDMNWKEHEQGKKKPHAKAPPSAEGSTENGKASGSPPRTVWSNGDGAQQETPEQACSETVTPDPTGVDGG